VYIEYLCIHTVPCKGPQAQNTHTNSEDAGVYFLQPENFFAHPQICNYYYTSLKKWAFGSHA